MVLRTNAATSPAAGSCGAPGPRGHDHDWAIVDVETSGLVARRDRVLSLAVVLVGSDGQAVGEFSTLLNPGCDPGPVHIHGLTAERLRGAPAFEQVARRIGTLLESRVMVAHNAHFDYDFLAHEFARARLPLPVSQRLCTLALNRQVGPPTSDLTLGTLAAHYGVPRTRAHDALDDARVLAGVLRGTLREADRLGLPLPLVACPPRQAPRFVPTAPKTACAYRNPGRLRPDGPLVQGMKVAITGQTETPRPELVALSVSAGLNVMGSVSRYTSALVSNETSSYSAKARRAAADGVPVIDEETFLRLLGDVRPGTPHRTSTAGESTDAPQSPRTTTGTVSTREVAVPAPRPGSTVDGGGAPSAAGPLSGLRVLVLGGSHEDAAAARARIVRSGGSAAVNLSRSVTDVVLLAGGENDSRMVRVAELGLPVHGAQWLHSERPGDNSPDTSASSGATVRPHAPLVLPRGGVVDLTSAPAVPGAPTWHTTATWVPLKRCEVDLVAFALDDDEQVFSDEDFVFYGAPENPAGTVRLLTDGPNEQTISVDLTQLPPACHKVVISAALDGAATFADVGAIEVTARPGRSAAPLVHTTLDAATTERTLLLAEFYRRGAMWRFRAVGQGYDHGLDVLAGGYGVHITDESREGQPGGRA
ncbi:TerD family protein [Streptomyces sp. NPDC050560]|uniref:TerD family protein n=1 Tax=Streptomyces sp. NPDC050560 TaxID=3365630 RepID=UPI003790D5E3